MDINFIQFIANISALAVIGWIYIAYIKNLRSISNAKDSQISIVESNLKLWRDKANELERKTPEYIEKVLTERIKIREDELKRLHDDTVDHKKQIKARNEDLGRLRSELEKTKDVGRSISIYDIDIDDEVIIPNSELELELLGEVFVDSATLMITDPMYIQSDWHEEEYIPIPRKYRDVITGKTYEFEVDFKHYEEVIEDLGDTPNNLIKEGRLCYIEVEDPSKYNMTFTGALYASGSKKRYGALSFSNGEKGAAIAVGTVHGDGVYPVYGEKHNGELLRVYIDLQ